MENKLKENLKQAQLNRDGLKVSTLRLVLSEISNFRISKGSDLTDDEVISVLQKEAKKRKESIESYKKGGREELALKEESELKILEEYLPEELSNEELTKIIEESITEVGAKSLADMGRVMGIVMVKVSGQADGGKVSTLVRQKLSV